jgi:hypothetical protein
MRERAVGVTAMKQNGQNPRIGAWGVYIVVGMVQVRLGRLVRGGVVRLDQLGLW